MCGLFLKKNLIILWLCCLAAWPGPAHSVAICEGLEDWAAATDFSNISDSDEDDDDDQLAPLVRLFSCKLFSYILFFLYRFFLSFIFYTIPFGEILSQLFAFQLSGRYRVMVESSMASADDIIFNCGDVIELVHEDSSGMW